MAAINNVTLTGRMVRSIEPKTTESGKKVATFSIAVDGYKEDEVNFITCVAWEKTVEIIEKYAPKGKQVGIVGRLQVRNYDDKEGKKRSSTEVVVTQLQLLGSKADSDNAAPADEHTERQPGAVDPNDEDFNKPIDLSEIPF